MHCLRLPTPWQSGGGIHSTVHTLFRLERCQCQHIHRGVISEYPSRGHVDEILPGSGQLSSPGLACRVLEASIASMLNVDSPCCFACTTLRSCFLCSFPSQKLFYSRMMQLPHDKERFSSPAMLSIPESQESRTPRCLVVYLPTVYSGREAVSSELNGLASVGSVGWLLQGFQWAWLSMQSITMPCMCRTGSSSSFLSGEHCP